MMLGVNIDLREDHPLVFAFGSLRKQLGGALDKLSSVELQWDRTVVGKREGRTGFGLQRPYSNC